MKNTAIQLIIEGTQYPEAVGNEGSYRCYEDDLSINLRMAEGNIVQEERGRVTVIEYSYPYFEDSLLKKCLSDLRVKKFVTCLYRDMDNHELKQSEFLCTALSTPSYLMTVNGVTYWTNISFTLREVDPHD